MFKAIVECPKYFINEDGIVRSKGGKEIKGCLIKTGNSAGYYRTNLQNVNGKLVSRYIHRLVALTFLENPLNLPEVNHVDGDKSHNYLSNLEWQNKTGNMQHAKRTGLFKAPAPGWKIMKKPEIQAMLDMDKAGLSGYAIAKKLKRDTATIYRALAREKGKNV